MDSSEEDRSKKDVRSRTEMFVLVTKMNRVRVGKLKSRRSVRMEYNERLVSFGIRPPKIFGSFMSICVIPGSFPISRYFNSGADDEKFLNKRSK